MRIFLQNARLIDPLSHLDEEGDLLIDHGRIAVIGRGPVAKDAEVVDCTGLVLAPGLVDMHVHLRDPGQTEKEDILSGCRAAAAGGVTTLLCMPNTRPTIDTPETVRYVLDKAAHATAHVCVAGALTMHLGGEQRTDMAALRDAGVTAFSDDGRPVTDSRLMADALREAAALGVPVVSHCEDLPLSAGGKMHEGEVSRDLGVPGVPAAAEDCGTARELALAAAYEVPVHICHVSTRTSVALIRDYKRRGVQVTCETAPHYFALTDEALRGKDADLRMNPPLRTEADRWAVIEGLQDGTIDAIATDHAPHTPAEKADFLGAPNGTIGMETSLAAGLTYLVHPGYLTLSQLLYKMTAGPAQILHLPCGRLEVGAPADLVLFDPDERWSVDPAKLHGKSRNAAFKGQTLTGRVRRTYLAGKLVYCAP